MKLTIIKNPFDNNSRAFKDIEPNKPIFELVRPFIPDCKYEIILDDRVIPFEESKAIIPKDDQTLAIRATIGGSSSSNKNILSAVASLALAITTLGVGSLIAGGTFIGSGMVATGWGMASWLGALGVSLVGGYLMNLWFGADDDDSETTYDWGSVEANDREGGAVQMTYGTIKVGASGQAQVLSQYITYDGSYQYLNVLLCGGEGPCDYTGDGENDNCTGISNIEINDNAIANYDDVIVYKRAGLNNQSIIPNFDDSYDVKSLSYELAYDPDEESEWKTDQTYGVGAGLEIVFQFPSGLYRVKDSGSLASTSVIIQSQYKLVADSDWTDWDTWTISAKQNEPLYIVKRLDNITEGQYDVRARCTSKSGTSTSYSNATYWISVATITYDNFTRPNKVLLAIKALATDQLSGNVNVTWNQTRSYVYVWVPDDETNPWGSGSYIQKPANNPAWACYDIIHGCYRLYNINTSAYEYVIKRIAANRILYADFKQWADFCDEYEITCAYFVNETQTLWDSLSPLETIGRGKVLPFGTHLGVLANFPGDVVQKFNYSNIIAESFQGEFVGQSDRANALEVSFLDADREFKRHYFPAYGTDYNEAETVNPTSIFLQACDSLPVAWRHAQYQLRLNKYLYRSAKWQCDVDSISCRVGDVVGVTTPKWGTGGRIVDVGDNWIEVEKTIDAFGEVIDGVERTPLATYIVKITLSDDTIITRTVRQLISCAIFGRAGYTLESENGSITGTRIYFTEEFANDRAVATYIDDTTFTVVGDLTANFPADKTDLILYAGYGDMYQTTIVSSSYNGTLTTVVCDNVPSDITEARWGFTKPDQYNLYSFGTNGTDCKLFRLTRIERHDDLTATLSGLEYIEEVYQDDTEVPEIESGADTGTVTVSVTEHTDQGGDLYLDIGWLPSRKIYYGALVFINGTQVAKVDMSVNIYSYKVADIGEYIIKIVTLDYFGNPFVNASKTYTVVGETAPGDVTNLDIAYKGDQVYLAWDIVSDSRSISYEVRKGTDANNASSLGRTSNNEYPIMGDGTYWVATYYRTLYGDWKGVVVENSLDNTNVVVQYSETESGWAGTCTDAIIDELYFDDIEDFDSIVSLDSSLKRLELDPSATLGYYTIAAADIVDILYEAKCTITVDLGAITPTGTTAIVQINVGDASETYAGWSNFNNSQKYIGRYFNFRIKLTSETVGIIPIVSAFGFVVDMPDVKEYGNDVLIPAAKTTITYAKTFHSIPSFIPFVLDSVAGDTISVTNKTLTSVDVEITNSESYVSREIDYLVRGY